GGHTVLGLWQAKAPGQPLTSYVLPGALTADLWPWLKVWYKS
ncbi:hypothetical protein HNQ93_004386, partial [Hymenobacter luteus]|nr:hypothetical protein [Hymenobacter latericoloratus]MBB6061505.1 hypothetical protein [Hymenobacter luteus]